MKRTLLETVLAQLCTYPAPARVVPPVRASIPHTTLEIPAHHLTALRRRSAERKAA